MGTQNGIWRGVKPNMEDYNKTYSRFKWEDGHSELKWFEDGRLNAAYETIDRHAEGKLKNKIALYCENVEGAVKKYTFSELKTLTNKFANVLRAAGVKKGDRVFIFLPRGTELFVGLLGAVKAGAIGATIFAAFGPEAVKDRLVDSGASILLTDSELKKRVDVIRGELPELKSIICVGDCESDKDVLSFDEEMKRASSKFDAEKMDPDDYSFMLYTSGTTGKPKGVVHRHLAILQQHMTAKWVLDLHEKDKFWCTADPGWVTGIAYGIFGVWSNGATKICYSGRFDPEKWYSIIEKHQVNVWYTAPTAIRMLMKAGSEIAREYDLGSLRHVCSVGEPLNPEAVRWSEKTLGMQVYDNWWQTETGGILIANYPCMQIKPGSMGKPIPGIRAGVVDDDGNELPVNREGNLAILPSWPSMMQAIWGDKEKYNSYFKKGWYMSGDIAMVDSDGYFWFVGRADDIINTSGHRVGPFEVESALIEHPAVAETGVIGKPDALRGEIIKAFIVLNRGYSISEGLEEEIKSFTKKRLGGHAYPREIEIVDNLPKTRSGKIMRRMLKARELGLPVGDTSTLEE